VAIYRVASVFRDLMLGSLRDASISSAKR